MTDVTDIGKFYQVTVDNHVYFFTKDQGDLDLDTYLTSIQREAEALSAITE